MLFHRLLSALVLVSLCLTLAPTASAQKVNNKYRQFPAIGMEFKAFKDMSDVPINDRMKSRRVIAQGQAKRGPQVKSEEGNRFQYTPSLYVFYDEPQGPMTGEGSETTKSSYKARKPAEYLSSVLGGMTVKKGTEPVVEEFLSSKKITGSLSRFETTGRTNYGKVDLTVDVYTFYDGQAKLVFVWDYPAGKKTAKKWGKAIKKSMKSVRYIPKPEEETDLAEVNSESSYEDLFAYHKKDVEQTPGWELIPTPSKNYLIKTNSEDRKDLKVVIARLEASRRLYEQDFPPSEPITSVSVVRICNTREEFGTYGQTGGGVAGYFSPGSEELVLFFGDGSIKETLGVMTHEAFHQYCHFLFNRSAAHRWFDEGHGDYYGAWTLKGKNLKPGKDMKGGLSRLPHLKELFRKDQLAPLSKHIRYDHPKWQNQGPQNISNYCQSFGLIYFLREGARRKVPNKYWEKEYAQIIPNYIRVLNEGFRSAYKEVAEEAQKDLDRLEKKSDPDQGQIERLQEIIASPWDGFRMTPNFGAKRQTIWDNAMEASWGQVDEEEFEKNWLDYVDKVL